MSCNLFAQLKSFWMPLELRILGAFVWNAVLVVVLPRFVGAQDGVPSPDDLLRDLPSQLTADVPQDVDRDLLAKFKAEKQLPRQHLLFDILSWREFVALCWPLDKEGKPYADPNQQETRRFETWKTDDDTFRPDGAHPGPWGTNHLNIRYAAAGVRPGVRALDKLNAVFGTLPSKPPHGIHESTQAFAAPLWDQHGWMVRYEIYLNRDEFDYIVANELFNLDGQIAFNRVGKQVSLPINEGPDKLGAMEVKLAWKVLDESQGDAPNRFLTSRGIIFTGKDGKQPQEQLLGLVGMHINHKTKASPQWIWSTFMHVDSLQTDSLESKDGKGIQPLFVDLANDIAIINTPAQTTSQPPAPPAVFVDGQAPTQVLQLTPVSLATERVNRVARGALSQRQSVLQHYTLLGTQWPTDPSAIPSSPDKLPDSITNKPGGRPTPVYLINPLLETYFQKGNQPAFLQEETSTDQTQVFGTESCMGCHSSAAIANGVTVDQGVKQATFAGQLSGDFSWLFSRRASFKH